MVCGSHSQTEDPWDEELRMQRLLLLCLARCAAVGALEKTPPVLGGQRHLVHGLGVAGCPLGMKLCYLFCQDKFQ